MDRAGLLIVVMRVGVVLMLAVNASNRAFGIQWHWTVPTLALFATVVSAVIYFGWVRKRERR